MTYIIQKDTLTNLADVVREKTNKTTQMTPIEITQALAELPSLESVSVSLTFKTFVGYYMYYDGTSWNTTYTGAATKSFTTAKGFPIFICINKSSYSLSSIRTSSGTVSTEAAFLDDSNSACTYFTPMTDCTVIVQGTW